MDFPPPSCWHVYSVQRSGNFLRKFAHEGRPSDTLAKPLDCLHNTPRLRSKTVRKINKANEKGTKREDVPGNRWWWWWWKGDVGKRPSTFKPAYENLYSEKETVRKSQGQIHPTVIQGHWDTPTLLHLDVHILFYNRGLIIFFVDWPLFRVKGRCFKLGPFRLHYSLSFGGFEFGHEYSFALSFWRWEYPSLRKMCARLKVVTLI